MNSMESAQTWKKCSTCKKPINTGARYYVCSVSTCNGQRTGYVFCSVICFESHLPGARHRDAGAIEKMAPKNSSEESTEARLAQRIVVRGPATNQPPASSQEVLVIASRLKEYIQARSDFNTSASVMDMLSQHLRLLCDRAIDYAREDGRKTVMDRDFEFLRDWHK